MLTGRADECSQALDRVDDSLVPKGPQGLLNGRAREPRLLDQGMLTGDRLARLVKTGCDPLLDQVGQLLPPGNIRSEHQARVPSKEKHNIPAPDYTCVHSSCERRPDEWHG